MSVSVGGQATIALVPPLMWLAAPMLAMSQKEYGFLFFGFDEEATNKRGMNVPFELAQHHIKYYQTNALDSKAMFQKFRASSSKTHRGDAPHVLRGAG